MTEWITNTMTSLGYLGIGLLMFLENLFPPIPSELIMPLAGFTIAQGKMSFVPAVLAGVIGTMLGALPWYYAGKLMGERRLRRLVDRYGRWLTLSGKDIDKANSWFSRHGAKTVLFCRLIPGIRTLISLPAGINDMPIALFLLYSTVGTALWVVLLTALGYFLGNNYSLVETYLAPVSKLVLLGLLVALVVWAVRRKGRRVIR
ncbi:DedA family protein [Stenomitos frigidus]|uniref:Alkaline phosphatase n=1 Tax=Stenomitos frigidus ULC18 TaxID=2107698 RepID=A0A2T1ENU4_9CYAN|nr:DedA family protein [Stenomitos frigidus]PSB34373.1 alkaline phosphatase [Stenomitos frigidus ULC18]